MKKISLIISLLFVFVATAAHAHGPVRAKLTATVMIDAPANQVWDVIKNFDDMSWLPAVAATEGKGGNKKGATRVLTLQNGGKITEKLKSYKADKMSMKYKITDMTSQGTIHHAGKDEPIPVLPVNNYAATLSVKAKGNGSEVKWVATYYRAYMNNNPPAELNEEAADAAVSSVLGDGLAALQKKFEPNANGSDVKIKIKR